MSYVLTRLLNDLELAQQLTKTAFADLNEKYTWLVTRGSSNPAGSPQGRLAPDGQAHVLWR
jgi:hypothetical protein